MKQSFLLSCFLAIFAIGCANPDEPVKSDSLDTTFTWPNCASSAGNPESTTTMNDSRESCTSCDLVNPCTNPTDSKTTYTWYSPKIFTLCAKNCPPHTDVGDFCAQAYVSTSVKTGTNGTNYYTHIDKTRPVPYTQNYYFYAIFSDSARAAYGSNPTLYCGDGIWTLGSGILFPFPACPTPTPSPQ